MLELVIHKIAQWKIIFDKLVGVSKLKSNLNKDFVQKYGNK